MASARSFLVPVVTRRYLSSRVVTR